VRDSLIVQFEKHAPGKAPDGRKVDKPFYSAQYDFALAVAA
jgi:hydroxyquinol 1,2-dioxygenase